MPSHERRFNRGTAVATRFRLLSCFTLLLCAGGVSAQGAPPQQCADKPGFGDWDFWVGEWNVYSNDDARQLQGTNSITKHHGECLIKESWLSVQGTGGFSINYYNPVKDEWRQTWVANGYAIDCTGGLDDNGAMVLEGHLYNYATSTTSKFRGIWTPQTDGSVIQHFDIHNAGDDTWSVWFEGLYVPK